MALRRAYTQPQQGGQGFARTRKVFGVASLAIAVGDLVTGNQVAAFMVPKDFVLTGINAVVSDMDSGAALTLSIGDAASSTRLVNASTAGQAAGTISALAAGALYYQYPADTEVLVTTTLQPAGAVAGTITNFYLEGFIV